MIRIIPGLRQVALQYMSGRPLLRSYNQTSSLFWSQSRSRSNHDLSNSADTSRDEIVPENSICQDTVVKEIDANGNPATTSTNPRLELFRQAFEYPPSTHVPFSEGKEVTVHGWLGKSRVKSSSLIFCDLTRTTGDDIQIVSNLIKSDDIEASEFEKRQTIHRMLKTIPSYSAVAVTGTLAARPRKMDELSESTSQKLWDLKLKSIQCLNPFPEDIIVSKDANWSPKQRHLQMRFDTLLRERLELRSHIASAASKSLRSQAFTEVETPVLFKSTPEGAREFLVPSRRHGYAYALPQSPQQYKQVLMAGRMGNYFQFARCFRDEDSRMDRQPEFTQLDLEMSFASRTNVMQAVETCILSVLRYMIQAYTFENINGVRHPRKFKERSSLSAFNPDDDTESRRFPWFPSKFPRMSYDYAMRDFGSDKPDLRIPSNIQRIDSFLTKDFVRMLTKLEDPVVEAAQFRLQGTTDENMAFIRNFMESVPSSTLKLSGEATPGVFVVDESRPLRGLSALGHEVVAKLEKLENNYWLKLQHGDVLVIHARKNAPFHGEGSTELGQLRKAIYDAAVKENLMLQDNKFRFVWITEFPMFKKNDPDLVAFGEGQGGVSGFSATHHPFTAPLTAEDFALLEKNPLEAKADTYDLVLNGVEIGGGSRRIHVAEIQEYIMRDVLKMPQSRIDHFSHLLEALRSGCPPHAGFALGFDRFIALLCDVESVRDVIAFPKNNKGVDPFADSPGEVSAEGLAVYGLGKLSKD